MTAHPHRVAITGIGVVSPLGHDIETVWQSLLAGRSATATIRSFDPGPYPSRMAAEVRDFDPGRWIDARTLRFTGRTTHFALAAAAQAMAQAGWAGGNLDLTRAATVLGSGYGSMPSVEAAYRNFFTAGGEANASYTLPACMPNAASSQVAITWGLGGPSFTLSAACASGAAAIAAALEMVRSGAVPRALCGGVDACILPGVLSIWCPLKVLSTRNHDPAGASAPFSADRDGMVLGEGACILAIERRDEALGRGAAIFAELAGAGSNTAGASVLAPDLAGAAAAIRLALADGRVAPEEVVHVNAHGTATRINDAIETAAIRRVFGAGAGRLKVSATKSMHGHMMGASSALGCALAALALRHQAAPPTINLRQPDPECDLDYVPEKPSPIDGEVAVSNSFAFGGINVCLALRRHRA